MCPTINEESDYLRKKLLQRSHTKLGGGQGKWALWQFRPTTEESLKNALHSTELSKYIWQLKQSNIEYSIRAGKF